MRSARDTEINNLYFWRRSGVPFDWVMRHPGGWNHGDWLGLLEELKKTRYWPMNEAEVGRTLESLRVAGSLGSRFEAVCDASPRVLYTRIKKKLDSLWYNWYSESWDDQAMTAVLTTRDYRDDADSWKDLGELAVKAALGMFFRHHGHGMHRRPSWTDRQSTFRCDIGVVANPTRVFACFKSSDASKVSTSIWADILALC